MKWITTSLPGSIIRSKSNIHNSRFEQLNTHLKPEKLCAADVEMEEGPLSIDNVCLEISVGPKDAMVSDNDDFD